MRSFKSDRANNSRYKSGRIAIHRSGEINSISIGKRHIKINYCNFYYMRLFFSSYLLILELGLRFEVLSFKFWVSEFSF
ncbi:MAG: hypothetical protein ACRC62_16940 [Microcoleus sp.]